MSNLSHEVQKRTKYLRLHFQLWSRDGTTKKQYHHLSCLAFQSAWKAAVAMLEKKISGDSSVSAEAP